jgi:hypothetical protein
MESEERAKVRKVKKLFIWIFTVLIVALVCVEAHAKTDFMITGHKWVDETQDIWDPKTQTFKTAPKTFTDFVIDGVAQKVDNGSWTSITIPSSYSLDSEEFGDYLYLGDNINMCPTYADIQLTIGSYSVSALGPLNVNSKNHGDFGTIDGSTYFDQYAIIGKPPTGGSVSQVGDPSDMGPNAANFVIDSLSVNFSANMSTGYVTQTITLYDQPEPATILSLLFGTVGIAIRKRNKV